MTVFNKSWLIVNCCLHLDSKYALLIVLFIKTTLKSETVYLIKQLTLINK